MRTITLRLSSGVTSVRGGGSSARACASESQPSSNGSRSVLSKRTRGLKVAPRPLCTMWRSSRGMGQG